MADDIPVGGGALSQANQYLTDVFGAINRNIEGKPSEERRMNIPRLTHMGGGIMRDNTNLNQAFGKPGAPTTTQQMLGGAMSALGALRPGLGAMPVSMRTSGMRPETVYMNAPAKGIINQPANNYQSRNLVDAVRGMPDFPMPAPMANQPNSPPTIGRLMHQMLSQRAQSPSGITPETRNSNQFNPNMRPQSFNPNLERQLVPGDAIFGTDVMTPANRSPQQSYNLALIRQLLGGNGPQ